MAWLHFHTVLCSSEFDTFTYQNSSPPIALVSDYIIKSPKFNPVIPVGHSLFERAKTFNEFPLGLQYVLGTMDDY